MTTQSKPENSRLLTQIETRSIDYVPVHERKGRVFDQATIWFAGNAHLLTLATGAIGISLGLNLGWTLIGLLLGSIVGTIPVSAHATQGPHLGLPQMVQSRPQFGRYGALFIWAMAIVVYWGYIVIGGNLLGTTAQDLGGGDPTLWAVVVGIVAMVLAVFGYHWLHAAQRVISTLLVLAVLVYVAGITFGGMLPANAFDLSQTFEVAPFLTVVSAAAAYQLSWAFFVSDYSRYMPADTSKATIIGLTSGGLLAGIMAMEAVGATCASVLPDDGIILSLIKTGNSVAPGLGQVMVVFGGVALLGLNAMCVYGGSLTLITALDSFKTVDPTRRIRLVTILIVGVTATIACAALPSDFLNTSFTTVLAVLAYLMAPWTSVNLTDFFVVRRGHYSVREIFRKDGIYGLWNWRGITAYLLTFALMVPFMNLSFFKGPVATALGGVDIAFFVGVPAGCLIYWLLCRTLDVKAELATIAVADRDLDAIAQPVE